jgi:hypothetical protein
MQGFSISRRVAAPIERVFAVFTDFSGSPSRIPEIVQIEMLTSGPVGVGTRFRETRKVFREKTATELIEVTVFEPPRRVGMRCTSCGVRYDMEWRFAVIENPDGSLSMGTGPTGGTIDPGLTTIDFELRGTPVSLMARLMSPLAGVFLGIMRRAIEKDLDRLTESLGRD